MVALSEGERDSDYQNPSLPLADSIAKYASSGSAVLLEFEQSVNPSYLPEGKGLIHWQPGKC